jgi:hypothetical protein
MSTGFLVSELGVGPFEMPRADVKFGCTTPEGVEMLKNMVRAARATVRLYALASAAPARLSLCSTAR